MSFACSRWKLTDLELVAGNNRTGMETSPKVRLAVDIERAGMIETSARSQRESYCDRVLPGRSMITFPRTCLLIFRRERNPVGQESKLIEDYREKTVESPGIAEMH
jgi:hypothetical protein